MGPECFGAGSWKSARILTKAWLGPNHPTGPVDPRELAINSHLCKSVRKRLTSVKPRGREGVERGYRCSFPKCAACRGAAMTEAQVHFETFLADCRRIDLQRLPDSKTRSPSLRRSTADVEKDQRAALRRAALVDGNILYRLVKT